MFGIVELMLVPLYLLFAIPLVLAMFVFWIWMLVHAIQNKGLSDGERISWVLVLVFVHLLGAILYFFIGRPKANAPLPPEYRPV
jgi:hypothetical protein